MFHERVGVLFAVQVGAQDVLYCDWLIYGIAFVLAIGLLYLRFLLNLPSRTRNWIVGAAAVFLFGALGVETFFAASYVGPLGFTDDPLQRMALYALEEVSECIGVLLLIYGLLDHLGRMHAVLNPEFKI